MCSYEVESILETWKFLTARFFNHLDASYAVVSRSCSMDPLSVYTDRSVLGVCMGFNRMNRLLLWKLCCAEQTIQKLELSLLRLYVVNAIKTGHREKAVDFFKSFISFSNLPAVDSCIFLHAAHGKFPLDSIAMLSLDTPTN